MNKKRTTTKGTVMNKQTQTTSSAANKKRFNFVDVALILLIIGFILTLVYLFSPISMVKKYGKIQEKNIEYTIEIIGVDKTFVENIKEGDTVIDSVSKANIGTVKSIDTIKYTEYKAVVDDETDTSENKQQRPLTTVDFNDTYNLHITVNVNANYIDGEGFSVDSTRIAVGEKFFVKFPNFTGEGYCIGIIQN